MTIPNFLKDQGMYVPNSAIRKEGFGINPIQLDTAKFERMYPDAIRRKPLLISENNTRVDYTYPNRAILISNEVDNIVFWMPDMSNTSGKKGILNTGYWYEIHNTTDHPVTLQLENQQKEFTACVLNIEETGMVHFVAGVWEFMPYSFLTLYEFVQTQVQLFSDQNIGDIIDVMNQILEFNEAIQIVTTEVLDASNIVNQTQQEVLNLAESITALEQTIQNQKALVQSNCSIVDGFQKSIQDSIKDTENALKEVDRRLKIVVDQQMDIEVHQKDILEFQDGDGSLFSTGADAVYSDKFARDIFKVLNIKEPTVGSEYTLVPLFEELQTRLTDYNVRHLKIGDILNLKCYDGFQDTQAMIAGFNPYKDTINTKNHIIFAFRHAPFTGNTINLSQNDKTPQQLATRVKNSLIYANLFNAVGGRTDFFYSLQRTRCGQSFATEIGLLSEFEVTGTSVYGYDALGDPLSYGVGFENQIHLPLFASSTYMRCKTRDGIRSPWLLETSLNTQKYGSLFPSCTTLSVTENGILLPVIVHPSISISPWFAICGK